MACRLRSVALFRSLGTNTRSRKSGPGRWSNDLSTVWQRCLSNEEASSPSRSVIRSIPDVVATAIGLLLLLGLLCLHPTGGRRRALCPGDGQRAQGRAAG